MIAVIPPQQAKTGLAGDPGDRKSKTLPQINADITDQEIARMQKLPTIV
ncbi:MAG: hypothetical protein WCE73_02645 [Candidatus Angelobacter sp.]